MNLFYFLFIIFICIFLESKCGKAQEPRIWSRSSLIYHVAESERNTDSWKRHLMRIKDDGSYSGQWLFDAAILLATTINGKSTAYASDIQGDECTQLLDQFFADAKKLDGAATELANQYGNPPYENSKIQVSITIPYLSRFNRNFRLGGENLDFSRNEDLMRATRWYIDQVKRRSVEAKWNKLYLFGIYYMREDAVNMRQDPDWIYQLNKYVHSVNLMSVWCPYYEAPNTWNETLGFDIVVMQPSYAFTSGIDGGDVRGDRVYATGYKSANYKRNFEYEVRGNGESNYEYWISHQYLHIADLTGVTKYPQIFFVGDGIDFFDVTRNQRSSTGRSWNAYTELADYLNGNTNSIHNLELWVPSDQCNREFIWRPEYNIQSLTSIRLDFEDGNRQNIWRGSVDITQVNGNTRFNSYGVRAGSEDIQFYNGYQAVFVPFPLFIPGNQITQVGIRINCQSGSPNIQRLVAVTQEPTYIPNPIFEEFTISSRMVKEGPYPDSKNTHLTYDTGKLTDGAVSPNGYWSWDGVLAWRLYAAGRFSIVIDLQNVFTISSVQISTYFDQLSGVNFPGRISAMTSSNCAPKFMGGDCKPTATSGELRLISEYSEKTSDRAHNGTIVLSFSNDRGRFVTISGVSPGFFMVDEISVFDNQNSIVSRNKPYKLSPRPYSERDPAYSDDSRVLVDGFVVDSWIFSHSCVGITGNNGYVQSYWNRAKTASALIIWVARDRPNYGIFTPSYVDIQWRDNRRNWRNSVRAYPANCGPALCARLNLTSNTQITGIRGNFPSTDSWFMVSEISIV